MLHSARLLAARALWITAAACSNVASPAAPCEYSGGLIVSADRTITSSCTVTGDLTVTGHAHLLIDYTNAPGAVFVVAGNIMIRDSAILEARGAASGNGSAFVVANGFTSEFTIQNTGHGTLTLDHIELRTRARGSAADGSRSMNYHADGDAVMIVDGATLDPLTSWLLADFNGRARLQAQHTNQVPTEIYLHDSCTVTIGGADTRTGLWFESPPSGTITLPVQGGAYSWEMGMAQGFGVGWQLSITGAPVGIGMQSLPGSHVTVNGHGMPATGEFKVGYFVSGGTDTLRHLAVGLQNGTVGGGRITFNNVNLGPIAWQVYAGAAETLRIDSSVVNEIGLFGAASVTVDHSVLQLAVLGAVAPGAVLDVNNSDVWNQLIEAVNGGTIRLTSSRITGSLFDARDAASSIVITGGSFANNPGGCTANAMVDVSTGQPLCDPFRPPGPPTRTGAGPVTCSGTTGCSF